MDSGDHENYLEIHYYLESFELPVFGISSHIFCLLFICCSQSKLFCVFQACLDMQLAQHATLIEMAWVACLVMLSDDGCWQDTKFEANGAVYVLCHSSKSKKSIDQHCYDCSTSCWDAAMAYNVILLLHLQVGQ